MTERPERHHVWGDDLEERDASEAIAQFETTDRGKQEHWHDHRSIYPFKVVAGFIGRNAKRVAVTIVGFAVLLLGIAGLFLPILQGWLLIFVGLGILATEYVWAQRLLNKAKEQALKAKDMAMGKKQRRAQKKEARRAAKRGGPPAPDPTATPGHPSPSSNEAPES